MIKVKFHCGFMTDEKTYNYINNLYLTDKSGSYENIKMVTDNSYDYFVIINYPTEQNYNPKKQLFFKQSLT
jgi:hypothetical protein